MAKHGKESIWKKLLCAGLISCTVLGGGIGLAACEEEEKSGSAADEFQTAYSLYVVYAEANGEEAVSYEDWLASIKGEKGEKGDKGDKGDKGEDGETPVITIGDNGNWYINGADTGKPSQGEAGQPAAAPVITIGENGNWYIDGKDTGKPSRGESGTGGSGTAAMPVITIGENGNWYIDGKDTGKSSVGTPGQSAAAPVVTIGENGNWYVDGKDTGKPSRGENGAPATAPVITIGENGNWYVDGKDTGKPSRGENGAPATAPVITIGENGNWYIDGKDTGKPSKGEDGVSVTDVQVAYGTNEQGETVIIFTFYMSSGNTIVCELPVEGGNIGGGTVDPENPAPENPDPENPAPENPDPENPEPEDSRKVYKTYRVAEGPQCLIGTETVSLYADGTCGPVDYALNYDLDEETGTLVAHWVYDYGTPTDLYFSIVEETVNVYIPEGNFVEYTDGTEILRVYDSGFVVVGLAKEGLDCYTVTASVNTETNILAFMDREVKLKDDGTFAPVTEEGGDTSDPDPENPDPENPDPENPDSENPTIASVLPTKTIGVFTSMTEEEIRQQICKEVQLEVVYSDGTSKYVAITSDMIAKIEPSTIGLMAYITYEGREIRMNMYLQSDGMDEDTFAAYKAECLQNMANEWAAVQEKYEVTEDDLGEYESLYSEMENAETESDIEAVQVGFANFVERIRLDAGGDFESIKAEMLQYLEEDWDTVRTNYTVTAEQQATYEDIYARALKVTTEEEAYKIAEEYAKFSDGIVFGDNGDNGETGNDFETLKAEFLASMATAWADTCKTYAVTSEQELQYQNIYKQAQVATTEDELMAFGEEFSVLLNEVMGENGDNGDEAEPAQIVKVEVDGTLYVRGEDLAAAGDDLCSLVNGNLRVYDSNGNVMTVAITTDMVKSAALTENNTILAVIVYEGFEVQTEIMIITSVIGGDYIMGM